MAAPTLTLHSVERFQQRVLCGGTRTAARCALEEFMAKGRSRPRPRHWMSAQRAQPGTVFVYCADRPRVCAIVRDNAVVTVLTVFEARIRRDRTPRPMPSKRSQRRSRNCHRPSRRWTPADEDYS
jgi:hypothetical protein